MRSVPSKKIRQFWGWFQAHSSELASLYDQKRFKELTRTINLNIDQLGRDLAWEVGPGKGSKYSFTISAEGNTELRPLAVAIAKGAPAILGWEVYSSKQSRKAPARVRLPNREATISTRWWRFVPQDDFELGKIHLTVVNRGLAKMDRETALLGVTLFLDATLGEDNVEKWIGNLRIASPSEVKSRSYPIGDVADYVLWATNRESRPIKKRLHRA